MIFPFFVPSNFITLALVRVPLAFSVGVMSAVSLFTAAAVAPADAIAPSELPI